MENRNFTCKIDDDFQVPDTNIRVLSLDCDYEAHTPGMDVVEIDNVIPLRWKLRPSLDLHSEHKLL